MFQGSLPINMDAKGRMAIPSKYRDPLTAACEGRLIVTASPYERCLMIYPEPQWQVLSKKIAGLNNAHAATRRLQRLVLGNATEVELDSNGRILLPQILRDYASLDKKLVFVGLSEKAELWSEEGWNAQLDAQDDGELPDELLNLSL